MKKGSKHTQESIARMQMAMKKVKSWNDGSKEALERIEQCRKMGKKYGGTVFERGDHRLTGANNPNWKGGVTPELTRLRHTHQYKLWKKAVYEKDNYKCIWCGSSENIHADHIESFAKNKELRFEISNGRTLCYKCHLKTETWGWKSNKHYRGNEVSA